MKKPELLEALKRAHADTCSYFESLSPDDFFRSTTGWTAAENLEHLSKATSGTLLGFRSPRAILGLAFGKKSSRSFDEVRDEYESILAQGKGAGALYQPRSQKADASKQKAMIEKFRKSCEKLERAVSSWSEEDLDKCGIPHPLLGKLSGREMAYFCIFHPAHHLEKLKSKLATAN